MKHIRPKTSCENRWALMSEKTFNIFINFSSRWTKSIFQKFTIIEIINTQVELPYISCKKLAQVVHILHYLQESSKNLRFQTNLSDTGRPDISCRSRLLLQDSLTDLARQCLKLERFSARKCLENTENVQIVFSILNQENFQNVCECLTYGVARTSMWPNLLKYVLFILELPVLGAARLPRWLHRT